MDEIEEVVNQVINMAELLLTSERLLKAYELISKLQIPASKSR